MLVVYDPRIFRDIIFLLIRRFFFPVHRIAFFSVCSRTSLLVEEVNKRKSVYDFVFVMVCMTVSSTSMQFKKRQKLFIHPIEFTALFTHYRFFVLK